MDSLSLVDVRHNAASLPLWRGSRNSRTCLLGHDPAIFCAWARPYTSDRKALANATDRARTETVGNAPKETIAPFDLARATGKPQGQNEAARERARSDHL
jgi:hypothetical protein